MQDDNLPTTGAAGAIVLLAQTLKAVKTAVKSAVQSITTSDKHIEIERTENDISISLVDVASKKDTNTALAELAKKDETHDGDITKLKTFTGYQDDLDLNAKITEILGE